MRRESRENWKEGKWKGRERKKRQGKGVLVSLGARAGGLEA